MEEAKKRHNMTTDSRYIDRYHGPDDMVHFDTKLSELESKGTNTGSTSVAKNSSNELQSSAAKNKRRAKQMQKKRKKINKPSKRQGGPYRQEEINFFLLSLILQGIAINDANQVNESLLLYLDFYKRVLIPAEDYWDTDEEFIADAAVALANLAQHRGIKITAEQDLMPQQLIR